MKIFLAVLLLAPAAASASGVGTTGAQFLKVGVGARPLAMGGAFSALPDDANAINWNPGALTQAKGKTLTASYNALFQDENQGFLGYSSPTGEGGALGLGFNYLMVSNVPRRSDETEEPDSTFSNRNFAAGLTYAHSLPGERLSLGGTLKYVHEDLDTFQGNAMALDFGLFCRTPVEHLTAGASLMNLGTKIGPDPLPLAFKGGLAYRLLKDRLAVASDVDWLAVDQRAYWDNGVEFWADKALAVRAGYQLGRGPDKAGTLVGFASGFGLRLSGLSLDYAFVPFGDLGNTHRFTLGWRF